MNIPAARWHNAIQTRRSRRRYRDEVLKSSHVKKIQSICHDFRPYEEARTVFVKDTPDEVFKGIIGSYGIIRGAKSFIAFIGNTKSSYVQERLGYTGEGVVLQAEVLGLNTCWVGGFFRREVVASYLDLGENEQVFAISPIGYAVEKPTFGETLITGFGWTHRRKSLSKIATGMKEKNWPEWVKISLQAARLAPSAMNRQPWRFVVDEKGITVAVNNNSIKREEVMSRRLDCGIAMLHIETAALDFGINGTWEFLEPPTVARFRIE